MRKLTFWSLALAIVLVAPAAFAVTGSGEVQVNTNSTVVMTLGQNTSLALVGWTPVVNSMTASFGSINAYINCNSCTYADLNAFAGQSATAHVGQFTTAAGPPIILYPAWQQNGPMIINNNVAGTKTVTFGCVGGSTNGACLFNLRTVPAADPSF